MKKGSLNFLGRKNQSLFDTNRPLQIQEMENGFPENLELMLDSSAIPDTGTAKVRSRPTVKHHIPSSESVHGFAVPTPTVPLVNMFDGGRSDGSDGDRLSNGSLLSLSEPGDFFVPPPPSQAPPPPPPSQAPPPPPTMFVLPPPDFLGELDSPTIAMFERPPMAPPKPPSQPPALQDLTLLRPPNMTAPKPPSIGSSVSTPTSTPPPSVVAELPDRPKFAPPKAPAEKHLRSAKMPPPKPTRLSSMASIDGPAPPSSPSASGQMSTPSSFNPQNTAKLYNAPKTSVLSGNGDTDARPKQILLLQDSIPEAVKVNGNALPTLPFKPIRGTAQGTQPEPRVNPPANVAAKTALVQPKSEAKAVVSRLQEKSQLPPPLPDVPPKFSKEPATAEPIDVAKLAESTSRKGSYSPLIDRKLRNLKGHETSRDGPAASPLALLQAAKERDKHRSTGSHDRSPRSSIKHRSSAPNSFVITPRSNSVSSAASRSGDEEVDSLFGAAGTISTTAQTQALHAAPPSVKSPAVIPSTPAPSGPAPSPGRPAAEVRAATLSADYRRSQVSPTEPPMALLPPPPEFANFNFGDSIDRPPDFPPPDPPSKKAPAPIIKPFHAAAAPSPPPKPKPAAPPQSPAPVQEARPQVQTLPRLPVPKPLPVSESQATLLSILQKKMQEMDHKMTPKREVESNSDEWGSHVPDEDHKIPFTPRSTPQSYKSYTLPAKNANLDMRELETKVAKKQQDIPSASNNGTPQKQHGMTFTVRPGTKQPITLVSKGEPS